MSLVRQIEELADSVQREGSFAVVIRDVDDWVEFVKLVNPHTIYNANVSLYPTKYQCLAVATYIPAYQARIVLLLYEEDLGNFLEDKLIDRELKLQH